MGLIQVPRGISTKRGYAPADIAHSAAESAAPWAWQGHLAGFANNQIYIGGTPTTGAVENGSGQVVRSISSLGRCFICDTDANLRIPAPALAGGVAYATTYLIVGGTKVADDFGRRTFEFRTSADDAMSSGLNAQGTPFLFTQGGNTLTDANNNPKDLIDGAVHIATLLWRQQDNTVICYVDGSHLYTNSSYTDDSSGTGVFYTIGESSTLPNQSYDGQQIMQHIVQADWSEEMVMELHHDPFAPFRRRPLLVPVSSGSGATTGTITDGAQGSDGWLAVAVASGAVTEPVQAGDTLSSVATVGMALTEAVSAQDSDAGPAQALGAVTESVTGNDLADAVAQISAAITAGASAGESWVAQAQALVDLVESGAAGDTVTQGAQDVTAAAISEGSQAGETFVAAVEAVASITGASTASDALIAALVAIGSVTESAQASGTFTASTETLVSRSITHAANASDSQSAVAQIVSALTEAIDAAALYTASAAVAQSIAEAVQAGDAWSAVVPGTGYLVASAITITAALSGSINIKPSLSGSVRIKPD